MKKAPLVVSFSGIDGAGKSTQIEYLSRRLARQGLRVRVIPFWDQIARLTWIRESSGHVLFKGDKGVGSPSRPIERRDKNVRSWPMCLVRYLLYFLDAISARAVLKGASLSGVDFVILDRWIYDELANLNLHKSANRAYSRLLLRIAPQPQCGFVLDANPMDARARKPEYPLEFLISNRLSYLSLSNLASGIKVIPPMDVQSVERSIVDHILQSSSRGGIQGLSGETAPVGAESLTL
jgi:thymidylate kinase